MGKYIMLSTLTDEGRKTVKMRPERIKEVNTELEKMGEDFCYSRKRYQKQSVATLVQETRFKKLF